MYADEYDDVSLSIQSIAASQIIELFFSTTTKPMDTSLLEIHGSMPRMNDTLDIKVLSIPNIVCRK